MPVTWKRMIVISTAGMLLWNARPLLAEPAPTRHELKSLAAAARTADDHRALASQYRLQAERLSAEARDHARRARAFERYPSARDSKQPMAPMTAAHARHFASRNFRAAHEALKQAAIHENILRRLEP